MDYLDAYTESGMVIPCTFKSEEVSLVCQMYLDDDPPIAAGREIWGFPWRTDAASAPRLTRQKNETIQSLLSAIS